MGRESRGESVSRRAEHALRVRVSALIPETVLDGLMFDEEKGFERTVEPTRFPYYRVEPTGNPLTNSFSQHLYIPEFESVTQALQLFNNQIVVDIGAGENPFGYLLAERGGARGYVGVERYFGAGLHAALNSVMLLAQTEEFSEKGTIPAAVVQEDMLSFLKRLPENSVSVLCSGIDGCIIQDNVYAEQTGAEIARVLSPDGAYLGERMGFIGLPRSAHITATAHPADYPHLYSFRKTSTTKGRRS